MKHRTLLIEFFAGIFLAAGAGFRSGGLEDGGISALSGCFSRKRMYL